MRVRSLCETRPVLYHTKSCSSTAIQDGSKLTTVRLGGTVIAAWVLMKVVVALGRMLCRGFLRDFFSACFSCVAACGAVSAFRRLPQLRQPAAELCRADRKCARQSVSACRISQTACHTTMLWCCGSAFPRRRSEFAPVALHRCTSSQPSTDSAVGCSHNAVSGGSGFHCFRPSILVVCKRHAFVRT